MLLIAWWFVIVIVAAFAVTVAVAWRLGREAERDRWHVEIRRAQIEALRRQRHATQVEALERLQPPPE